MEESPNFYDVGKFGAWDYVVLALMLAISAGIGIFYALTGGRQSTTQEFLLADRSMSPFPVAMSLVATFISAITVLGTPAEVYINGSMFMIFCFGYIGSGFVASMFLPTFYRLGITSANEVTISTCYLLVIITNVMIIFSSNTSINYIDSLLFR